MQRKNQTHTFIQIFCTLSLFLLFAICSLFLLSIGASNYKGVLGDADKNFNSNASLRYVSNKLHSYDMEGCISIQNFNNTDCLVLSNNIIMEDYHTIIYYYDDYLYELLIQKNTGFKLGNGEKILKTKNFSFEKLSTNTILLKAENTNNKIITSFVVLKATNFREENENA